MVNSIDQALITEFSDQVHIEAEQSKSRLRGLFIEKSVSGNDYAYERLDTNVLPIEITARHADTVGEEVAHTRRQIKMRDFAKTFFLDQFDDLQVLINAGSEYAAATSRAMMRQYDKLIIDAATSSVNTGRNFGTTTSAANDGVTTIVHNSEGLSYDKLKTIKENFNNAEVGIDEDEEIIILCTGQQMTNMLEEVELTSSDFNNHVYIEEGHIKRALGMRIILFGTTSGTNFIPKASTTRSCLAMSSRAVCMGVNKDITIKVNDRPDKNNLQQVQARFFLGAIRTEGALVQVVECTEV